jgi:glutamine synthetase
MPDALDALRGSDILRHYLGTDFVDLYDSCKSDELSRFERHVSELETQWYLSTL